MDSTSKAVYLVIQIDVKNYDEYFRRYATSVVAMLQKAGAEAIALSPTPKILEGEWPGNWTGVIRFPSMKVAEEWYNSEEYEPLKALRINELTRGGSLALIEAFDPATLGGKSE